MSQIRSIALGLAVLAGTAPVVQAQAKPQPPRRLHRAS